jgi:hypothetical protein
MTKVNLKKIAKYFSGAIFFDGEGAVEIKEASAFYIFPTDSEMTNNVDSDGEPAIFTTLFSWAEEDVNNNQDCNKFDMDSLLNTTAVKEMNDIKRKFENLTDTQKKQFLDYANQF